MKKTKQVLTHWEECWEDSGHHACAIAKISELQVLLATKQEEYDAAIERALRENRQLRQQLAEAQADLLDKARLVQLGLRLELAKAQLDIEQAGTTNLAQRAELADVYHRAEQAEARLEMQP